MNHAKSILFLVLIMFLMSVFVPCYALGQDLPPPKCCDDAPPPPGPDSVVGSGTQGQVTMPDSVLLAMGISRSQFLDRLAATLFPDQQITLIFSITATINTSASEQSPQLVTITYQYMIPRSQMTPEQIDALDQVVITDGVTYIQITFTQTQSPTPLQ
jgi:hypothetical protein